MACAAACCSFIVLQAQITPKPGTDVTTPLHAMQPDYPVPYGTMSAADIKKVLDKVFDYLDAATPPQMVLKSSGEVVTDPSRFDTSMMLQPGDFRLNSYEWGVTYSGMLLAAENSGDTRYSDYEKSVLPLWRIGCRLLKRRWKQAF